MTREEHYSLLGALVGNFHSLEFILRVFLNNLPGARKCGWPHGTDVYDYPVGTELSVCDLTDHNHFRELVNRYNKEVRQGGYGEEIDTKIVDVRNAIAHGRVCMGKIDEVPLHLLQFSNKKDSRVTITFNALMTVDWFKQNRRQVYDDIRRVEASYQKLMQSKGKAS